MRSVLRIAAGLSLAALLLVAAAGGARAARTTVLDEIALSVNDKSVTRNELEQFRQLQEMQARQQYKGDELKERLASLGRDVQQQLIDDLLLESYAAQAKINVSDKEIEERVDSVLRRDPNLQEQYTDEQIKSYVLKDLLRRRVLAREVDARVHVSHADVVAACRAQAMDTRELDVGHILLRQDDAESRARLEALRQQLLAGANFDELALKNSQDPSVATNKGHLGFISRGQFVKPFEDAAFTLRPGQVSEPVKTRFGLHLITVFGERAKGQVNCEKLDDVTQQSLENQIFARKREEELSRFMSRIRQQADIRIVSQ